jgi:hypothetical protein
LATENLARPLSSLQHGGAVERGARAVGQLDDPPLALGGAVDVGQAGPPGDPGSDGDHQAGGQAGPDRRTAAGPRPASVLGAAQVLQGFAAKRDQAGGGGLRLDRPPSGDGVVQQAAVGGVGLEPGLEIGLLGW